MRGRGTDKERKFKFLVKTFLQHLTATHGRAAMLLVALQICNSCPSSPTALNTAFVCKPYEETLGLPGCSLLINNIVRSMITTMLINLYASKTHTLTDI